MSHYDVSYSGNDTPEDRAKAIQDIKDYLGDSKFEKVSADLKGYFTALMKVRSPKEVEESFYMFVSLAGVRGYPAKIWMTTLLGFTATPTNTL